MVYNNTPETHWRKMRKKNRFFFFKKNSQSAFYYRITQKSPLLLNSRALKDCQIDNKLQCLIKWELDALLRSTMKIHIPWFKVNENDKRTDHSFFHTMAIEPYWQCQENIWCWVLFDYDHKIFFAVFFWILEWINNKQKPWKRLNLSFSFVPIFFVFVKIQNVFAYLMRLLMHCDMVLFVHEWIKLRRALLTNS